MDSILNVYLLNPKAAIPQRSTNGSVGYDIRACLPKGWEIYRIKPWDSLLIPTGIAIQTSPGICARICSRSGLMSKENVFVPGGIIDKDYYGEIYVVLYNFSSKEYEVIDSTRIAQLVFDFYAIPDIRLVTKPIATSSHHGFGSTGMI